MNPLNLQGAPVLVVGAGIMGAGIAQVAAAAGHRVMLFDAREGAAGAARDKLASTFDTLVAKGKLAAEQAQVTLARIEPIAALAQAVDARLVVEAIVEDPAAKRTLLRQLEAVLDADAVLATNTSSISVTALAAGLAQPQRLVGMHFFNPVPLMKLVEVVSGLHTDPEVAAAIFDLAAAWGKVPVHARSTPGFIVNRIARPYYAEALSLLHEQATTPQVLDACLRAAGFRMGPCELMDLIGHDTNFAVTNSVYEANFFDKRYLPSLVQRELVDGGWLGRKSGRGFYRYPEGVPALPVALHEAPATAREITVHGADAVADYLEQAATTALAQQGWGPHRERGSGWTGLAIDGLHLVLTDGRPAYAWAAAQGRANVAVFDRPLVLPAAPGTALAYAVAAGAGDTCHSQAPAWLAALGFTPLNVADTPGLVVARTVAMLVNEAADAVLQGVCTPEGADAAMKLGVNYPAGPFEWLARWGVPGVAGVIDALDALYRGERYRLSPGLRQQACALP
uniref:3-hydroxybutyryl-CoA dehydrogenase n=1 Tax=uncultured microorganism TaxID=358574 RepID=F8UGZ8_9ZZZZ|nr:3-hydroxybutyryl-CoA dehydrogenase [uncultured microorganism]